MKVADYIANFVAEKGVRYIHTIMGGGAATLNDSFGKHPDLKYVPYHSEAGASYAAFGEAKFTNQVAIINPTTGIAGVNAMAGVLSAWQDSAPVLIISGNVPVAQTTLNTQMKKGVSPRQVGIQENNINALVGPITKANYFLLEAERVREILEEAFSLCMEGRKGPVWVDIPADIAATEINPDELKGLPTIIPFCRLHKDEYVQKVVRKILGSDAPLVLAGNGIHTSNTREEFGRFIEKYNFPVVTTFLGVDLLPEYDLNIGRIGIKGNRAANFALQNCDKLLVLGSCLNMSHIGYLPDTFAGGAEIISVDIDENRTTLVKENVIKRDLRDFFKLCEQIG